MKFGKRVQEETEAIPLAPLIDIVFLMLVFFMTTSVFGAMERELDIQLPTANAAEQTQRAQGEIYINLKSDGTIILNDRAVTVAELQEILNRVAEHYPGGAIIIRGDRDAILGRAVDILNCCKNADIQNVSFAALSEDPKETR
ncbi:MAG: biopolymer transporter ExbD [bacterium]|nr:biopolymer transporter ExbD [bacterium]